MTGKKLKVLIIGGSGMMGHKAYQLFSTVFETWVTFRKFSEELNNTGLFDPSTRIDHVDVFSIESVEKAIITSQPDVVLNCVGVIKQLKDASNSKISIYINALFPHLLAEICGNRNIRLIHISTDCVFSGNSGMYTEADPSDAKDLYGRSKFLGELNYPRCLTLRTSIIGHELFSNVSLVDWFISQNRKEVHGYKKAIYTGFPTSFFAGELIRIIKEFPQLSGLYHVSSERISKFDLLTLIKDFYKLDITILPEQTFFCDRSLDSSVYRAETGFKPPAWTAMIADMFQDYKDLTNRRIAYV